MNRRGVVVCGGLAVFAIFCNRDAVNIEILMTRRQYRSVEPEIWVVRWRYNLEVVPEGGIELIGWLF